MALRIHEISPSQYDEWDAFVAASLQGTVYHLSAWKRVMDGATSATMRLFGCFDGERLIGGCALTEKVQLGYRAALNALTTHYAGFILPPCESTKVSDVFSREHSIISAFARFLTRHYHQIYLFNPPGLKDLRPLLATGWKVSPCYTYILEIGDEERLWDALEGSVRRSIRKAEQERFELRTSVDAGQMAEIVEQTFARRSFRGVLSTLLVRALCESPELAPYRFTLSAWSGQSTMASAIVALLDNRSAYYALAATRSDYLNSGVHSLLIWELLKHLGKKVRRFDFVGANIPSIARFKEGFNPRLETYFSVEKWTSSLFHCLKTAMRNWRKMKNSFAG
jgi:hypothetical protein